jgi:hypothetical protein
VWNGSTVHIRDQDPLQPSNMKLDAGWDIERFVEYLNGHVFFWPGTSSGPVVSGRNHFSRYGSEKPVVLRLPTSAALLANEPTAPLFCRYNSGAPRFNNGNPSPRPANTFTSANRISVTPGGVVEVVYDREVRLPPGTQVGNASLNVWKAL